MLYTYHILSCRPRAKLQTHASEEIKISSVNQTQFVLSLLYFINAKYFGTLLLAFRLANFKRMKRQNCHPNDVSAAYSRLDKISYILKTINTGMDCDVRSVGF